MAKKSPWYKIGGKQYLSVTTALKILDTGIGDWKARVGAKEAANVSKVESGVGTRVHHIIECDIKGVAPKLPKKISPAVENAVKGYFAWRSEINPTILGSEEIVHSDLHGYAGTLDAFGSDAIYDFKTSKKIHPIYWLQLAAYAAAKMEMAAKEGKQLAIKRLVVVRLDKELSTYAIEEREYSDDLFYSFLYTLRLWRYFNITEKEDEDDGTYERTRASIDIEPDRLRNGEEGADEEVDRSEDTDVRAGQMW